MLKMVKNAIITVNRVVFVDDDARTANHVVRQSKHAPAVSVLKIQIAISQ